MATSKFHALTHLVDLISHVQSTEYLDAGYRESSHRAMEGNYRKQSSMERQFFMTATLARVNVQLALKQVVIRNLETCRRSDGCVRSRSRDEAVVVG